MKLCREWIRRKFAPTLISISQCLRRIFYREFATGISANFSAFANPLSLCAWGRSSERDREREFFPRGISKWPSFRNCISSFKTLVGKLFSALWAFATPYQELKPDKSWAHLTFNVSLTNQSVSKLSGNFSTPFHKFQQNFSPSHACTYTYERKASKPFPNTNRVSAKR